MLMRGFAVPAVVPTSTWDGEGARHGSTGLCKPRDNCSNPPLPDTRIRMMPTSNSTALFAALLLAAILPGQIQDPPGKKQATVDFPLQIPALAALTAVLLGCAAGIARTRSAAPALPPRAAVYYLYQINIIWTPIKWHIK